MRGAAESTMAQVPSIPTGRPETRALLASAENPRLRDAVNRAEKRRLAGEEKVGAARTLTLTLTLALT